jgi:hypothetical protein
MRSMRPSNILIKAVLAIFLLIICYALGGILLKAFTTQQNEDTSSNMSLDCRTLNNNLRCIFYSIDSQ